MESLNELKNNRKALHTALRVLNSCSINRIDYKRAVNILTKEYHNYNKMIAKQSSIPEMINSMDKHGYTETQIAKILNISSGKVKYTLIKNGLLDNAWCEYHSMAIGFMVNEAGEWDWVSTRPLNTMSTAQMSAYIIQILQMIMKHHESLSFPDYHGAKKILNSIDLSADLSKQDIIKLASKLNKVVGITDNNYGNIDPTSALFGLANDVDYYVRTQYNVTEPDPKFMF